MKKKKELRIEKVTLRDLDDPSWMQWQAVKKRVTGALATKRITGVPVSPATLAPGADEAAVGTISNC